MELDQEVRKSWPVIRWDATGYLTDHDGYRARLFRGTLEPAVTRDLILGLRGVAGVVIRFIQGVLGAFLASAPVEPPTRRPYALLVVMGTDKYASEDRDMVEAFEGRDVGVRMIPVRQRARDAADPRRLCISSSLGPRDHVLAFMTWVQETLRGLRWFVSGDPRQRSLAASAIPAIWEFALCTVFARRIVATYGRPLVVLSQAPWAAVSVATIEHMRRQGVLTAAIRTQTTYASVEHLVINSDILFCKSPMERRAYEETFRGGGPRLEDGCLLSLPAQLDLDPLPLPEEYVLVVGTAPAFGQDYDLYARFNDRLFGAAVAANLPIVFKGHDLSRERDEAWFAEAREDVHDCLQVYDVRRNRELLDSASLVVSPASTLLYYAMMRETPVIVVENYIDSAGPDEFESAPILRFTWDQQVTLARIDWDSLRHSAASAKSWFVENYHLDKDPERMVGLLLKGVGDTGGTRPPGVVSTT